MELSYIYIMKIKAKRNWVDLKTNQQFTEGNTFDVVEAYGKRMIEIGHAEAVKENKPEPGAKAKRTKK